MFSIPIDLSQRPSQCQSDLQIVSDREDLYIVPGMVNCITCALDEQGPVTWQIEVDGDLVVATSPTAAQFATVEGNYLILMTPEDYVLLGSTGRRDIVCSGPGFPFLEARLVSPSKNIIFVIMLNLLKL
jgi:hypothetical protein